MQVFISLFRGVNVGGHRSVRMDALRKLHESLGFRDVRTYLQSGNAVFKSTGTDAAGIASEIESEFEMVFGFSANVILRTQEQIRGIVDKNPFRGEERREAKLLHFVFLSDSPDNEAKNELLHTHKGPEELFITDEGLYIYYTNGAGFSKLNNTLIERTLKVTGTARNWNTVTKLLELAEA